MHRDLRTCAAVLGAVAAAGFAGCGGDSSATASSQQGQPPNGYPGAGGFRGGPGGMDLTALAKALGVSETKLRKAMTSARPSGTPGARPTGTPGAGQQPGGGAGGAGGPGGALAATLAKALGLSESKVQKALQSVMPRGGQPPQGGQAAPAGTPAAGVSS